MPPSGQPPGGPGDRGLTPWERRSELGLLSAFFETWKQTMTEPGTFFGRADPKARVWDAILYAWIINIIGQLLNLPFGLLGIGRGNGAQDLSSLPPEMRERFAEFMAMASKLEGPVAALISTFVSIALYPLILIITAAIFHLFCLMFGVSKNGFSATLRTFAYAASPMVFGVWCFAMIAFIYYVALTIIGLAKMQETTGGKAAGAVLTPYVVFCCCCCGGIMMASFFAASGAK